MTALIIHARDASNICMHILYKKGDEWPKNMNDYQNFVPLCKSAIFSQFLIFAGWCNLVAPNF